MKIVVLMEDGRGISGQAGQCVCEHGLSLYVETDSRSLLVDTGASDAFLKNADVLSVDLSRVEAVFLSHGHYDHGGGLMAFAEKYPHIPIYLQETALEHFCRWREREEVCLGLDQRIAGLPSLRLLRGDFWLDGEVSVFVRGTERERTEDCAMAQGKEKENLPLRSLWPEGNRRLLVKRADVLYQDEFAHEQYVVLAAEGRRVLLSGCAHNGIVTVMEEFRRRFGCDPDAVISGFHLISRDGYGEKEERLIRETAKRLTEYNTCYYSGHCTGEVAFLMMREILGERLTPFGCGDVLEI